MRVTLRSLSILVLAAALFSACAPGDIAPLVTAQATSLPTPLPTPQAEPPSVVTPTQMVPSATSPSDVVHLGMAWADFSLRFDPGQWEISAFDYHWPGLQSLSHRTLAGCRITPNNPVGFGEGWRIEVTWIKPGQLELKIKSFYQS